MHDEASLARLMKSIDPAVTPPEAALSDRAERDLDQIVRGEFDSYADIASHNPRRAAWIAVPSVVAAVLVVILAFQAWSLFGAHTASRAEAATPPLLVAKPSSETYGEAMNRAISELRAVELSPGPATRRAAYATWNLDTDVDQRGKATSYISPQDVTMAWNADLSGTLTRVSGTSIPSDQAALPNQPKPLPPGIVIQASVYEAGQLAITNANEPPNSGAEALAYLQAEAGTGTTDPVALVDALGTVLNEWTLTKRQEAAMLDALRDIHGIAVFGTVTDRLGRDGIAFLAKSEHDKRYEDLLIVSSTTGQILSIEKIYLGGNAALKIPTPSVISYTAWKKDL